MTKLFLQSGKLMIGEFPEEPFSYCGCEMCERHKQERFDESVESAKASAVEAVNPEAILTWDDREVWFFEHRAMAEDRLYDIPSGWTVEIDTIETLPPKYEARLIPIKEQSSGIVATGIADVGQPESLTFLNEDDWTVPESGAPTYAARLACTRWLSQCLEFGWRKDQLDGLEKIWWQHHDRNGVLVKPDKAVSPPSQAERDSQEELWKEAINLYSKRDHSAVTSTDIEESMEQSRDVRIRADSPRTYETGYLDGYVDGVMVTQDLEPVSPPLQAEMEYEVWKEIYLGFQDGEGWVWFAERMMKEFTITRKTKL